MGVLPGADVAEAAEEGWADEVVVAENGGAGRQFGGDAAELAAVEDLAVREVDVGDGEGSEVHHLADAAEHGAGLQVDDAGGGEAMWAPIGEAVDAAGLEHALVAAAEEAGKLVHAGGRLLHEEQGRVFVADEVDDVVDGGADEAQQVPTDDLDQALMAGSGRWARRQGFGEGGGAARRRAG